MIPLKTISDAVQVGQIAAPELKKLKQATDSLEGFMFKSLLQTLGGKDGLFGSKVPGGQIYRDMFEQNFSELMAERGSLGMGKTIFDKVKPLAIAQARQQFQSKQKTTPSLETQA